MKYDFDIFFIGGGLNYAGAVIAARAGKKTALAERHMAHLGGTCLHNGCIPSKMYLHTAETLRRVRKSYLKGRLRLDMAKLDEEKEALLSRATEAITRQCANVTLIEGEAKLIAPHTVEVDKKRYRAKYIVIGTGAAPYIPDGIEYDGKRVVTSDEVLNMRSLPERIVVYGDGAIGLETASFFAAAGVKTELWWRHERLMRHAHPTIAEALRTQMENAGVKLCPNRTIVSAGTKEDTVHVMFENGKDVNIPLLLVATGRKARTNAVATPEVEIGEKGIRVDMHFETTLRNHYAVGDCNGLLPLAHAARAQVLYVTKRLLGENPPPFRVENVVRFIHTIPCGYATVGKNKAALEREGIRYKESLVMLEGLPFARSHDGEEGVMALYADEEGFLLGGELFVPGAEELIAAVAETLAGEMDAETAKRTVLAHPTFSESLEKAFFRL
jgi:dihydrolipoamide dehydrogenase